MDFTRSVSLKRKSHPPPKEKNGSPHGIFFQMEGGGPPPTLAPPPPLRRLWVVKSFHNSLNSVQCQENSYFSGIIRLTEIIALVSSVVRPHLAVITRLCVIFIREIWTDY